MKNFQQNFARISDDVLKFVKEKLVLRHAYLIETCFSKK